MDAATITAPGLAAGALSECDWVTNRVEGAVRIVDGIGLRGAPDRMPGVTERVIGSLIILARRAKTASLVWVGQGA